MFCSMSRGCIPPCITSERADVETVDALVEDAVLVTEEVRRHLPQIRGKRSDPEVSWLDDVPVGVAQPVIVMIPGLPPIRPGCQSS